MGQTRESRIKSFCRQIGVSLDVYNRNREIGYKWCFDCRDWHSFDMFGKDASRWDGMTASCLAKKRARRMASYIAKPPKSRRGKSYAIVRNGDKKQARARVNVLILSGLIPPPNDLPCHDCGHLYSVNGKRHEYHHESYDVGHHENVIALCTTCHHKRHSNKYKFKNG